MKTPQLAAMLLLLGALALQAGCSTTNPNGAAGQTRAQSTDQTKRNGATYYYGRDGMLGTTGANPNFPTSPTYHNYRADLTMIRDSLKGIPGLSDVRVSFRGPRAVITGTLPAGTTSQEISRLEGEAAEAAYRMVPRYQFRAKFHAR